MNPIIFKIAIIAVALMAWFWTQKRIAAKLPGGRGVRDGFHRLTRRLHRYLVTHPRLADRALVVSSFFIDAMGLGLIAAAVFGKSFAPFLAILIVFALRQACQMCCTLPPPRGMIWRHPGFPSVLVTYGVGNDLFFSGHTALAVLAAIEICQAGPAWLGGVAVVIALGEALIVLILRAHYTMDVIAGALAAWLAADVANRMAPWVDGWLR